MKALRFLPLVLLVIAIASGACGAASDDTASTTTTGATTTTGDQETISDGAHFGFVRQVADDDLVIDPAEFLSGERALNAAGAAGVIGATEDLPNDFYIDNPDGKDARLDVDLTAQFTLLESNGAGEITEKIVSYGELARLRAGTDDASAYYGFVVGELPMILTVADSRVTGGKQQYLP